MMDYEGMKPLMEFIALFILITGRSSMLISLSRPSEVCSHLEWSVDDEGIMHVSRLQNSFSFDSNRAGMFVMFASEGTDWEEMMSSYDTRDWVEKAFDVYKTDVDGPRSRTGDPDRARARFFIKMLALS